MGRGGWKNRMVKASTGFKPGDVLVRLHDEGDRLFFVEYVYTGETKQYVSVLVGEKKCPRSLLKGEEEARSLYPSRDDAIRAYIKRLESRVKIAHEAWQSRLTDLDRGRILVDAFRAIPQESPES